MRAKPDVLHFMLLGAHLQHENFGSAPGPAAALWGQGVANSIASTPQEPVCLHRAWRVPQPSQAVALHSVDTGMQSLF